ncbi:MAG: 3-oxoacyl-[acyl-carrier-protein] synthase III C-terminal domain-containing protein [Bdellovibrionota bacterium]
MHQKPILTNIQMIQPPYEKTQDELNDWLTECHIKAEKNSSEAERLKILFKRYLIKPTQIAKRSFECPDITDMNSWESKRVYKITNETRQGIDISERNKFFSERAQEIMQQFYNTNQNPPQHLIHVTCTGYVSPSAAQLLVSNKNWRQTAITHAYHMGCYAALPAIRIAEALAKKDFSVDIVHTEMCGLHLNPLDHTPEQTIVQSLFADGHIKYSIADGDSSRRGDLRILCIKEFVVPDSQADMSWMPSPWGMQMTLSRDVPDKIRQHLREFIVSLCAGYDLAEILKNSIFAIHPGGPKIIESVQKELELNDQQCLLSKKILFERGNMSSATLPHIWKEIVESNPTSETKIVSLAFGPGLTIFGAIFDVV